MPAEPHQTLTAVGTCAQCLAPVAFEGHRDACGSCAACKRIARGVHPDVLIVEPGETGTIKIEQVRDVIDRSGYKPFEGKRMSELAAARGGDPVDVLFDLLIEEDGSVPTVFFHHSEEDMQLVLKQPWTSIGSDGAAVNPEGPTGTSHPHPR